MVLTRDDARCKGVLWFSSCAETSAPCSINSWTVLELNWEHARCKGVDKASFFAVTSAPCSINSRTISSFVLGRTALSQSQSICQFISALRLTSNDTWGVALTQDDTRCKGVVWFSFRAVESAPCSIKSRTVSAFSMKDEARCRGVERLLSCAVTSAPCLINSRTVFIFVRSPLA